MGRNFVVDVDRCTACQLCVIACKDEHVGQSHQPWAQPQPDTGHFWIRIDTLERGHTPRVQVTHLPIHCQHCANAPCLRACPRGAIKRRDDGLVWIDATQCDGCGLCQQACPYDVIYLNPELNIAQKCTGCAHRIDQGHLPRCVDICPHEAITYGDVSGVASASFDVLRPEHGAEPTVYWRNLPKPWIAGTLIDRGRDEVIADATVIAVDLVESRSITIRTDAFGDFRIAGLSSGRKYRLEIYKDGYQPFRTVATTDGDQDLGEIALNPESTRPQS